MSEEEENRSEEVVAQVQVPGGIPGRVSLCRQVLIGRDPVPDLPPSCKLGTGGALYVKTGQA